MKERIEANQKLLEVLTETLCKYPDLRFIQALWDLGIINSKDLYYEESKNTLKRVTNVMNKGL